MDRILSFLIYSCEAAFKAQLSQRKVCFEHFLACDCHKSEFLSTPHRWFHYSFTTTLHVIHSLLLNHDWTVIEPWVQFHVTLLGTGCKIKNRSCLTKWRLLKDLANQHMHLMYKNRWKTISTALGLEQTAVNMEQWWTFPVVVDSARRSQKNPRPTSKELQTSLTSDKVSIHGVKILLAKNNTKACFTLEGVRPVTLGNDGSSSRIPAVKCAGGGSVMVWGY